MLVNFLQKNKILIVILVLAAILRLWDLGGFPPHLRNDEAALGYNAYSISKNLRDEHGNFLPLIFKSFGDWKMGLYVYLVVPFVAVLGLNEWTVRLPSAIAGIFSVLLLYRITKELFRKKTALFAAFLIAVSALFVPFSRGAWEVNVSLGLTLGGIYFFLKSLQNHRLIYLSSLFFGLTLLCSHGAKFTTPVIVLLLILIFFKEFKRIPRQSIIISLLILVIFSVPIALSFGEGKVSRLATLSIFSYPQDFTKAILSRWMSLYSVKTLFIKGDLNPQHGAPDMGPFLLMDAIFLLLGFIKLIKLGFKREVVFILSLLILLAVPSAFTIEKANFERVPTLFIPFLLIAALGLSSFWDKIGKKKWLLVSVIVLYITNYVYFLDQYFIHNPKKNDAWQYGYKQIAEKVTPIQANYRQVIVQKSLEQPHIFFLFYQKYDPQNYQKVIKDIFVPNPEGKDMGTVSQIDNIKFADINWKEKVESKTLYVMPKYLLDSQSKFYNQFKEIDTVYDLNGFPLFKLVETQ